MRDVSPGTLDSETSGLQGYWMPAGGDDEAMDSSRALAREAEPLRNSLTHYFRRRVRDSAEVEDLVQEVFTRIVARGEGQPVENLSGYVFQTAASVLADRARRRSVRQAQAHVAFDPERHGDQDIDP